MKSIASSATFGRATTVDVRARAAYCVVQCLVLNTVPHEDSPMPRTKDDYKTLLEKAKPFEKISDDACPGLFLFCKAPPDRAYWTYQFRDASRLSRNGKPAFTSCGFGAFDVVLPKKAREAVGDFKSALRVGLRNGLDFASALKAARDAIPEASYQRPRIAPPVSSAATTASAVAAETGSVSFADAVDAYIRDNGGEWAEKTRKGARNALLRLPLASKSVAAINTADVRASLLSEKEGGKGEGVPPGQRRDVRRWLEHCLDYAKASGWRTFDPDEGNPAVFKGARIRLWPKTKKSGKHHGSLLASELPALVKQLRADDSDAARALMFQILTAARPGEVENATWSQIYKKGTKAPAPNAVSHEILKGDAWIISGSEMKAGNLHRVPLTPAAHKLLGKPGQPGARLFPSLKFNALLNKAKQYCGSDVTAHGMRSSFRNWAGQRGKRDLAELAMAHKLPGSSSVERAYATDDLLEQRRPLMQQWAEFLERPRAKKSSR